MAFLLREQGGGPQRASPFSLGPLESGSRIAVIGAGPAGSFFALHALRTAEEQGKKINISLIDGKTFSESGPKGCNMCAGVIGDGLVKKLMGMDIPLTTQVIQQEILGYSFHVGDSLTSLYREPDAQIFTVFRGGGPPSMMEFAANISFDQLLLDTVKKRGAEYLPFNVSEVMGGAEGRPALLLNNGETLEVDLIVGAFGVNSPLPAKMPFGYNPPQTWHTCQAEVHWSNRQVRDRFQGMVHIFPINADGVDFIAATPKKEHVTLTAIGKHVKWRDLEKAVNNSNVKEFLPRGWIMNCHCHPQVPVRHAKLPYSNRIIIIGDAGYSRYLKNGIESAYYTAAFAAHTAFHFGVGRDHFKKYYLRWCREMFGMDNTIGRLMFYLHNRVMDIKYLAMAEQEQLIYEQERPFAVKQKLSDIIWSLFAGEIPYRKIMLNALDVDFQTTMAARLARLIARGSLDSSGGQPAKELSTPSVPEIFVEHK